MSVTTRWNITGVGTYLQNYLNKKLIANLEPQTRFYDMGMQASWQAGYNTLSWTRMRTFKVSTASATLVEWVTPTEQNVVMDSVTTSATQYGLYVIISDLLIKTEPTKSRGKAAENLGSNMARIYDNVVQDVLSTNGINVIYSGSATSRATIIATDYLVTLDLAKSSTFLATQGADEYGKWYVAVMHPNVIYDLFADTTTGKNFTEVVKYTSAVERIFSGEIGMIHNVRTIKSSNIQTFTNVWNIVVYHTYVMGKDAYGVAPLQALETYFTGTTENGQTDKSDPLNQRNYVGVKGAFASLILQQKALIRIESASRLAYAWDFNTDGSTTNF